MQLKNLINYIPKKYSKLDIKGLAVNSKKVKKNFIFFAIKGNKVNGEKYIKEAIDRGAVVIICSEKCTFKNNNIIIIKIKNIRNFLSQVAAKFYNLKPKNIIAVTGTNGKTSVADFFYQILNLNNIPVASIGTLGIKYNNKIMKTNLTSPDTITIHKILEKLKKNNIDNVIIEASSHGLDQNRLSHLNFKAGIFTNFSQDHLDYHKTMKAYLTSKLILFSELLPKKSYIISDKLNKEFVTLKKISKKKKLHLLDIKNILNHIKDTPQILTGYFQKKNLSMALLAARVCGLKDNRILNSLKKIKTIDGRMELVKKFSNNIKVFIDYAHTPEALSEAINSIRETYGKNISIVFGCGGERDLKKRPLMAKIAKFNCNKIYVTDDNPRKESPKKIRNQITSYLKECTYYNIGDRSKAIKTAILKADPNEVILIAGKGHESEQFYKNKTIIISDKEIIKKINVKINQKNKNFKYNSKILNKTTKTKKFFRFNNLVTDSRDVKKNNLFLAIKGKKNDGNKFISKAINKGASVIVSSKINKKHKNKILKVDNEIKFLNRFASLKRENCHANIIGITGSAGKTSLKNLLKELLQVFGETYASPKSFNNYLGVPISLSNLNIKHEYGVFEVGMSKAGEIKKLSKMIKPQIGIITNIGEAHIENFKDIRGIAKAKGEIIDHIQKNGTLILNRDDKFFSYLNNKAKLRKINVISFGKSKKANVHLIKMQTYKDYKLVTLNYDGKIFKLKTKNINIHNILCSIAVLNKFNLNLQKIVQLLRKFEPSDGRGRVHKITRYKKNFRLIDESYNANPLSVKIAITNFASIEKEKFKKYLLLGDMLELGKKSEKYHKNLSKLINSSDIDKVFIKGEKSLFAYKNLKKEKRGNIFQCDQDIDLTLENIIANNDYLMIKGSNATGLKNISNSMIKGN